MIKAEEISLGRCICPVIALVRMGVKAIASIVIISPSGRCKEKRHLCVHSADRDLWASEAHAATVMNCLGCLCPCLNLPMGKPPNGNLHSVLSFLFFCSNS